MPRSNRRASQRDVDTLHRLVAKELVAQLRASGKSKEPASAALIGQAVAFLKASETTAPAEPKRKDTLKGAMPDFDELEDGKQSTGAMSPGQSLTNLDFDALERGQ